MKKENIVCFKTLILNQITRRQNMMLNIEGYKKFVRKCRRQQTYCDNLQILLQGRQDNPIHEVAFNELIENLKERNTIWSNMNENSDRNH